MTSNVGFFNGRLGIAKSDPKVAVYINTQDAIKLPAGFTSQRPAGLNVEPGMMRYNTTTGKFEGFSGEAGAEAWGSLGDGSGGGGGGGGTSSGATGDTTLQGQTLESVDPNMSGLMTNQSTVVGGGDFEVMGSGTHANLDIIAPAGSANLNLKVGNAASTAATIGWNDTVIDFNKQVKINGDLTLTGNLLESDGVTQRIFSNWTVHSNGNDIYRPSGNVGIGTTDPGYALDVVGDIRGSGNIGLGEGHRLSWSNNYTSAAFGAIDGGQNYLKFLTNAAYRMTIDSAGNVGIGTTSPDSRLTINGGGIRIIQSTHYTTSRPPFNSNSLSQADYEICAHKDQNAGYLRLKAGNNSNCSRIDLSAWTGSTDHECDRNITFYTNNTERIRIDANGNVGIGTTDPGSYKLKVQGQIYASNNITSTGVILGAALQLGDGQLVRWGSSNYGASIQGDENSHLYFNVNNNQKVAIKDAKMYMVDMNVGIGTNAPVCKFDVNYPEAWTQHNNSAVRNELAPSDYIASFRPSSDNQDAFISIRASGESKDAGIYFGTPASTTAPNKAAIIAEGVGGFSKCKLHFCLATNSNNSYGQASISATEGKSMMAIQHNGNVGIGTTSPKERLDVGNGKICFQGSQFGGTCGISYYYGTQTYGRPVLLFDSGGSTILRSTDNSTDDGIRFQSYGGTERMFIRHDGNVGIGTASPGYKLEVNGQVRATSGFS